MHSLGISHRDIKPENIVCSQDGTRVRICDFGLATSGALERVWLWFDFLHRTW